MKSIFTLITAALFLVSCSKNNADLVRSSSNDLEFSLDQDHKSFTKAEAVTMERVGTKFVTITAAEGTEIFTVSVEVKDLKPGTYILKNAAVIYSDGRSSFSNTSTDQFSLTIDQVNGSEMSGSFNGVLFDSYHKQRNLTGGNFDHVTITVR